MTCGSGDRRVRRSRRCLYWGFGILHGLCSFGCWCFILGSGILGTRVAAGVLDTGKVSGFPGPGLDSGRKGSFCSSACYHGLQYSNGLYQSCGPGFGDEGRDALGQFYLSYKNNSLKGDNELILI